VPSCAPTSRGNDEQEKPLSQLERVPLREAWQHEVNDCTPWLAEEDKLNALPDALGGSELALEATEHGMGESKLDILCARSDEPVIISIQLEKTHHAHLGQMLSCAAGTGVRKMIAAEAEISGPPGAIGQHPFAVGL